MQKSYHKYIFISLAVLIVAASLVFTSLLTRRLNAEERKNMSIWAEAMVSFSQLNPEDTTNFGLIWNIIENNTQIPVIIADKDNNVISYINIRDLPQNPEKILQKKIAKFRGQNPPIKLLLSDTEEQYIYYGKSALISYLEIFPYIQLSLITVLLAVFFWAFASDKRAEQNRVWVGLSKETAHQLGTPISSLMGWREIMRDDPDVPKLLKDEISKDITRLKTISDRFSKIGSEPATDDEDVLKIIREQIDYLSLRTSDKVKFELISAEPIVITKINPPLFEWVIENLSKNAVDAMSGAGKITFNVHRQRGKILIDISDTGKGIPQKHFKSVFRPGYTTKQRGWGLGLSLTKRIVEDYHKGNIFILTSEPDKGTTFRIVLSEP